MGKGRQKRIEEEWEAKVKADEEWIEANPIEEEDDPEPWELPTTDPNYIANPLWGPDGIEGTADDTIL